MKSTHGIVHSRVRLYGIDAPEIDQRYGKGARDYLNYLVRKTGPHIFMTIRNVDVNLSHVAIVYCNSPYESLNYKMVEAGWAYWYEQYDPDDELGLRYAQKRAASSRIGLWQGEGIQERPWDYRKRLAGVGGTRRQNTTLWRERPDV